MKNKIKHFLIFFMIGYILSQMLPFLKNNVDLNPNCIFAMAALLFMIVQLISTYMIKSMKVIVGLLMMSSVLYYSKSLMIISMLFSFAFLKVLLSLDEVVMVKDSNYGILRAWAAMGMASGSIVAALFLSYELIFKIVLVVVSMIVFYFCDHHFDHKNKNIGKIDRKYIMIVLIYFMVYTITALDQYLVIEKMIALKASKLQISMKWALQALCEIPALFFLDKIAKKVKLKYLLYIAMLFYIIKFIGYGLSNQVFWIIVCASLQLVTLPLVNYTSKMMIGNNGKLQMIASIFFNGVSLVCAPLLSMILLEYLNYNLGLLLCALGLMIMTIFIIFAKNSLKCK